MSDEVSSKADYDWMVIDRDTWQQVATKATADLDAARADLADLNQVRYERDRALASFENLRNERDAATSEWAMQLAAKKVIIEERDVANQAAEISYQKLQQALLECDTARADLKQAEENNYGLMTELQNMRVGLEVATEERDAAEARAENECNAELTVKVNNLVQQLLLVTADLDAARTEVLRLTTERDAAEREKQLTWENLQRMIRKCDAVILERDVSRDENYRLREERNKLHKENEGLRADALAYPPQRIDPKQYADLKADFDRQVIMIETLQEGLKRTEAVLAKAQAQHIDPRLKGFLATISQLADQSQDLLP